MKKISLIIILLSLASCWINADEKTTNVETNNNALEIKEYTVWLKENNFINIYWNIVDNNTNTLTSNINWKIDYLNCEIWKQVWKDTIIAKINPDNDSLSYKSNLIEIESYKNQLQNLNKIKESTISNYDSQLKQLELQKKELTNQLNAVDNTIWKNDDEWIKNQLKILDETTDLLNKNKANTLKKIEDNIINYRKTIYNSTKTGIKRLDEVFWITEKNKSLNDSYDKYLWIKNSNLKSTTKEKIKTLLNDFSNTDETLSNYDNNSLILFIDSTSNIFIDSANVVDNSTASIWALEESTITALYKEFMSYSDWLINLKWSFENLENSKESTILSFDAQIKELEQAKSQINTQESNLNSNTQTIKNNEQSLEEKILNINDAKESSIKELEIKILSISQAINQINITFNENIIYAWISGIVKSKNSNLWNSIWIWSPICTISPNENWLKLEIYSPEKLEVWQKFNYYKDSKLIWEWKIISESPIKNQITQNLTYQGEIWFLWLKEWDYLDIKVLTEWNQDEIWIPISYVKPKLDWYYVSKKQDDKYINTKVEVWNMNNWEILIKSWLINWDILKQ